MALQFGHIAGYPPGATFGSERALVVRCDVTEWDDQRRLVAEALERFGRIDAAFANAGFGAKRGMKTDILMHGRGAGDDGPLLTPRAKGEHVRDVCIEKGNAWVWKPTAHSDDGRLSFTWGGDVVVTDKGGEPLFERPHGMVSITQ